MSLKSIFLLVCMSNIGGMAFLSSTSSYASKIYAYQNNEGGVMFTDRAQTDKSLKQIKITRYADSNIHSYSNWGSSEAAVLPSYSKNKNAFDYIIQKAAQQHGIAEGLIKAVMHTESGFNVYAKSPVGAQGLMQLMPATAKRFNVSNAYDPHQNIMAGAKYLSWLLRRFDGNVSLALAGYNAGEGNVKKYGGIPPFRETQDYVRRVKSRYQNLYANGVSTSSIQNMAEPAIQKANFTVAETQPKREIIQKEDGTFTYGTASRGSGASAMKISMSSP